MPSQGRDMTESDALAVTAVLYAIFLAMCIQGLFHWRREMGQAAG